MIKKTVDFSGWYTEVVLRAKLADYAPVKGCMVFMPYGYSLWENIQDVLDKMIKKGGVKNAYFPLFIPESLLKREKDHVEGFSPELAVVTIGGGETLKEKLIVRPTSETIMYEMYAKWLQSWRDLPILINQWNNVVRWEKRTYLFLRTTEFLWQEGHTAHATHREALRQVHDALSWYTTLYRRYLALDGIEGVKSNTEKFAGADKTFTYEMLMPDGKALQGCTSHDLGQNFAKVFNLRFQNQAGEEDLAWQTSWGLSTRSIGALIMSHGDDHGLILPPRLAPIQAVVIPIQKSGSISSELAATVHKIKSSLRRWRVEVDTREDQSVGWKFNEWELKGVPLRVEIGEREMAAKTVVLVRRDTGEKLTVKQSEIRQSVASCLKEIQENLFAKHSLFLQQHTFLIDSYDEFKKRMSTTRGFLKAFWCEDPKCESKIKEETKASTRCLPVSARKEKGRCVYCQKPADYRWVFAQAY